ncbi:flagellar basal body P-ring formation chaperone FlgA [Amphritea sp. HPY]|uniref:flagellar basal body P-ring formation chaperone FlgA n=1 Tax=Amphritea sp. HPY TaxID=3421652 RepID=UPI003D7DB69B
MIKTIYYGLASKLKHSVFTAVLITLIAIFAHPVKSYAGDIRTGITQQAENHLLSLYYAQAPLARTVIKLNPLPATLANRPCNQPIAFIHAPVRSSRLSLKAKCSSPEWTIFITGSIEQWRAIATSSRPLSKGTILGDRDIFLQDIDVRRFNKPYFLDASELIGRELKRSLGQHKPFSPSLLAKHMLVKKGDMVYIEAGVTNMQIRMTGTALQDGTMGQQISVQNNRSGKVVRGYVTAKGVINVSR